MKLVTFRVGGNAPRSGLLIDGGARVLDLQAAYLERYGRETARIASVLAIVEAGPEATDIVHSLSQTAAASQQPTLELDAVKLLAPIPHPPQMRDFAGFEKHLAQGLLQGRKLRASKSPDPEAAMKEMEEKKILAIPETWYRFPFYYHPNRLNVIGTDQDVTWPAYSKVMDFELEFGCYIGKPGKDIPKEKAREHIFGYTIFNDFSARDEQMIEMQSGAGAGKGKDFDGSKPMGPCLVTADELTDPYKLAMSVRVNGEEWGRGNSAEMHWRFEDFIARASISETLHSGEFIASGTVGNGSGIEFNRFLKSGDLVELEVEGIGVLRNRVRQWCLP